MDLKRKNEQSTKAKFINRLKGLKKKAYELSTLCDIDVTLLCFDGDKAHIWPEDQSRVSRVLRRYKDWNAGGGKVRKSVNQKITNHRPDDRRRKSLSVENLNMFLGMIDSKLAATRTKNEELSRCSPSAASTEAIFDELPPLSEVVSDIRLSSHYSMDDVYYERNTITVQVFTFSS